MTLQRIADASMRLYLIFISIFHAQVFLAFGINHCALVPRKSFSSSQRPQQLMMEAVLLTTVDAKFFADRMMVCQTYSPGFPLISKLVLLHMNESIVHHSNPWRCKLVSE